MKQFVMVILFLLASAGFLALVCMNQQITEQQAIIEKQKITIDAQRNVITIYHLMDKHYENIKPRSNLRID